MNALVQMVRWFNHASPWQQPKHSLAKRVERYVPVHAGSQVYTGVQGDLAMRLDLGSQMQRWIYLNVYDDVSLRLVRRLLRPGDVMVDAGANLGLYSLVGARAVGSQGRVYAFEPMPGNIERLRENLALSGVTQVQVIPMGCWHERSRATLHSFEDGNVGEPSMAVRSGKTVGQAFTIETVRIDEAVQGPVRLLKADIEGAEFGALRGATRLLESDTPPHLILELNIKTAEGFGYHPRELVSWLLQGPAGYRMHLLKSRRIVPIGEQRLNELFDDEPGKLRDVWFQPTR